MALALIILSGYSLDMPTDFTVSVVYWTGNYSIQLSISLRDFNNDHYQDIVVTNNNIHDVVLLFDDCNRTFVIILINSSENNSQPKSPFVGHVNNDI